MQITFPMPVSQTALFVVAIERLRFDIEGMLPWRMGRPHRRAAMAALGTPLLTLTHSTVQWRPGGVDLTEDERRLLRRTRQHVLVSSTAPPQALPASLQVARAAARAIAEECAGMVVDPLAGYALPSCARCAGEPSSFRLTDDWLGWSVDVHDTATCPPWNPADTRACDCLRVTSRGLRRFALPEITLDGAACAHNLCAVNLLRAVAQRLLADHLAFLSANPEARERTIDDHLRIHDQALFSDRQSFGVRLTPCESPGSIRRLKVGPAPGSGQITCLKVGPPSDFTGTLNDWLCSTQGASPVTYLTAA
ncbi:hypothetical protein ACFWY5_20230 [Nonomuraea sp. NPDC059007]|uniref:hypothetical protein n=1 Tax=Nonomuraea sp. NPDC059007 TaxID=3346692 RepID=UPI0036A16780